MSNDIYPTTLACPTCQKTPDPSLSAYREVDGNRRELWKVQCCNIECVSYSHDAVTRLWNEEATEYARRYRPRRPG